MAKEYIERDKALETLREWLDATGVIPKGTTYYHEALSCIEYVPAADVEEIDLAKRAHMKEYQQRYQKERNRLLKELKVCRACLKKDSLTEAGRSYCAECAEKGREYARRKNKAMKGAAKK